MIGEIFILITPYPEPNVTLTLSGVLPWLTWTCSDILLSAQPLVRVLLLLSLWELGCMSISLACVDTLMVQFCTRYLYIYSMGYIYTDNYPLECFFLLCEIDIFITM